MLSRDDEVLNCFFEESSEQLANVGDDLLEQQQGDDIDSELANCIFRGDSCGQRWFFLLRVGQTR